MLTKLLWSWVEKRLVFFPTREVEYTPDQLGLDYEEVYFSTGDGIQLNGWFVPGRTGSTWLCFHGNGGNIGHRVAELVLLHNNLGMNLLIFDYRGYGKSSSIPSEQGTYLDARAALNYLLERPDVDSKRLVYFAHSLGSAVAVELAVAEPPRGLVLVSPFDSMRAMARIAFPLLPLGWLTKDKYNSLARIGRIRRPLLILHGEKDELVPVAQGERLFKAANEPKTLQIVPDAGHNDILEAGGESYWGALERFIAELDAEDRRGMSVRLTRPWENRWV